MDERLDEAQVNGTGRDRLDVREGDSDPQVLHSSPGGYHRKGPGQTHWPGPLHPPPEEHDGAVYGGPAGRSSSRAATSAGD